VVEQDQNRKRKPLLLGAATLALLALICWLFWGSHPSSAPAKPESPRVSAPYIGQPVQPPPWTITPPLRTEEAATSPTPPAATATNAADLYRKAFALFDALTDEEKNIVRDWKAAIDADQAAKLCEKIRPILDLMHQAAAQTNCDWDTGPLTVDTLLPYLSPSSLLGKASLWNAVHCRTGDAVKATDDLLAGLQLGHHVSQSQSGLLGFILETFIQGYMAAFVAENASQFVGTSRIRLIRAFGDVSYEEGFYRSIDQEADCLVRLALKIESLPSAKAGELIRTMTGQSAEEGSNMDLSRWTLAIRQVAALQREYGSDLMKDETQYQVWLRRVQAAQETNPMMKILWPTTPLDGIFDRARAVVVQRAMVTAGLALIQDGPDSLAVHADPATGKPFVYQETADGFQLQSTYQLKGKAVVMTFQRQQSGK
jgi:hypothetical protein